MPRRLSAGLRVIGPSGFVLKIILAPSRFDSVLLAWHGSGPDFSVHVKGRLRCRVPFLERTASSRPRRRACTVNWERSLPASEPIFAVTRVVRKWQAHRIVTRRLRHSGSFKRAVSGWALALGRDDVTLRPRPLGVVSA